MKFINAIVSFFKNLFSGKDGFDQESKRYIGQYVDELPLENKIEDNRIYIVGENGYEWLVIFRCPCGCGDIIQLNLLEKGKHVWRIVSRNPKKISLIPSVDRVIGCRSHFTVTNGKIVWWRDQNFLVQKKYL